MIAGCPRLVALPLLGLLALTLACGSSDSADGSWPDGQDPNGADAAAPPSFDNGDGGGGGGGATGRCSADLRQVLAEDGSLLATCPEDQGCHGGRCIPACEAAALSKGSVGCDFYAPDPPFYGNGTAAPQNGPCFAVFLANTWSRPAQLGIERAGQSLDVSTAARIPRTVDGTTSYEPLPAEGLPANEVAILFLSHRPGVNNTSSLECPVPPVVLEDAAPSGTGRGQAFHVTTDTPLSAYDIVPYGGASSFLPSATLLFPATAWGTNYVAVAPHALGGGTLWTAIVGAEDGTTLTVSPRTNLPGGADVPAAPAEQSTTTIGRGEIVQWVGGDPSGMAVQSDKPVGLFAGTTYLGVATATSGTGGRDSAHQQLPHVAALGSEYVAAGVVTRMASEAPESVLYRIAGMVDGTVLQWDPMPPGAPATLDGRQIVDFESNTPFVVRSQDEEHPLLLTQYMSGAVSPSRPGCGASQSSCNLGDEEWINLLPPVQFLQRYVFFTDPTYSTTNLVIVRSKPEGAAGFADVELSCLGPVQGFAPLGSDGRYEYAHVDLQRAQVPVANCGTSRHEATSAQPFGVVVWGTDSFASYAYQAGGNIGSVNSVQVPVVVN